jgi:UDP-glucose:(glucosyl)LPS alpha-1,2-glucosyltransferase
LSCIYKGEVKDTDLSKNAIGGTEMMRGRLLSVVSSNLLTNVAIHLSRPREIYSDVKNILWCHDTAKDPENRILLNDGWKKFDHFVFVSCWQRDQFINEYRIPYSLCTVIENAIETEYESTQKQNDIINFVYHTTPHRGLEILYPVFDALSKEFSNIHLDVYSSFSIYGWESRDKPYEPLFNALKNHANISYHGSKPNTEVIASLKKSHIFAYPSIWPETSCIALIEAITCGCVAIHSNLAALPETSTGSSIMYDFTENHNDHAQRLYYSIKNVLDVEKAYPGFITKIADETSFSFAKSSKHNIKHFEKKWSSLLERITFV